MKRTLITTSLLLLIAAVIGGYFSYRDNSGDKLVYGRNADLPTLTFYTTGLATTPQFAFWSALEHGHILEHCNIHVRLWKGMNDLRGLLLAGKGDLWLGHSEGFAQAHAAGAPVQILTISGWKKFYLLSNDPDIQNLADFNHRELPYAPFGTPGVAVLKSVLQENERAIGFKPFEPKQLSAALISGKAHSALVPEPLVTRLLNNVEDLRIIVSVEDLYGQRNDSPARLPLAGLAINSDTARRHPQLTKLLVDEIMTAAKRLENSPEEGILALPEAFEPFIDKQTVKASLKRDLVLTKSAAEVKEELRTFLSLVMPQASADITDTLVWIR